MLIVRGVQHLGEPCPWVSLCTSALCSNLGSPDGSIHAFDASLLITKVAWRLSDQRENDLQAQNAQSVISLNEHLWF